MRRRVLTLAILLGGLAGAGHPPAQIPTPELESRLHTMEMKVSELQTANNAIIDNAQDMMKVLEQEHARTADLNKRLARVEKVERFLQVRY